MNKIKEIFEKIKKALFDGGDYKKPGIYPRDDWQKILIFIFIFTIFIISLNIFFYSKINKGDFWKNESSFDSRMDKINAVKMKSTLDNFKLKQDRFNLIKTGEKVTKDPYLNI